jgi:UDP-N-acetyl-D-glucosamine dehydrogenase
MGKSDLAGKIGRRTATIGIVGLGYVGLPLAVEFAKVGFNVIGLEQNPAKTKMVNSGRNYISDVDEKDLKAVIKNGRFAATGDFARLAGADAICICVPTPLDKNKQPDISYVRSVTKQIAKILHKGQLVVLESTTYPGTTEEVILTKLQSAGLKVGRDFYLAFSPERVDPGNKKFKTKDITKVVGGVTPECTKLAAQLYGTINAQIHPVSSPRVAEMEKLLENVFRSVNIALVNELAVLCKKMNIDMWEVIDAAKTKPYGFMAFYPGPGLGGHCIPLDPFYLSWKAREYDMNTRFIELAGEINDRMPEYVVQLVQDGLNQTGKSLKGARVLVLGAAYKKDIDDVRESPSLKLIKILRDKKAEVEYNDPHVPRLKVNGSTLVSAPLTSSSLKKADCVVIATDHSAYDYRQIFHNAQLIVDSRNAISRAGLRRSAKVIKI